MRHPRFYSDITAANRKAAVFVDYQNLHDVICSTLTKQASYPDECISEMIDELARFLADEDRSRVSIAVAFADFSALSGNGSYIQRSLYLQGIEPRFVPDSLHPNAVEMQLLADAVEVVHSRPDVDTIVVLTGNRTYLPLVQQARRRGKQALIACLERAPASEGMQYADDNHLLDAYNFLSESSRRLLAADRASGERAIRRPTESLPARDPADFGEVTDPVQIRTLDIVETHFGQYEEVYLTPLLRKLSELLDEREHDPKTIISELEELGAVRLEKRRGFPYDYTVLIVENEHPDVKRIQEQVLEREDFEDSAGDDDYDDEYYDEYDEDDYTDDLVEDEDDLSDEEPLSEQSLG